MALTTHEKIRVESGFQSRYMRQPFLNSPGSGATTFYVDNDDNTKIVPEFSTGSTIAGVSDVQVWIGLNGIFGSSQMSVSSVDPNTGAVTLNTAPSSGSSLTISYSSSSIPSLDVENVRKRAESIVNQRLALCYSLPLSPVPSDIESKTSRLASALLQIRAYGTGSQDTATDGYKLYEQLMGTGVIAGSGSMRTGLDVGEIGMICSANYLLVDDNGVIIPRNDDGSNIASSTFVSGGRVNGRLYDITEENFRFKAPQQDVDTPQPGTINSDLARVQG